MAFTPDNLLPHLPDLNTPTRWYVAYSGGLDSHVLLHAVAGLLARHDHAVELSAVHINHGISPNADAWEAHCQQVCDALGVPLIHRHADLDAAGETGASLETRARAARYRIFEDLLAPGAPLLMAHHQDDQMETLLYRLLRGSGPGGLASIPRQRALGAGRLLRPLLDQPRQALRDYARAHQLAWVEDESNRSDEADRNYLRLHVLPAIEKRWPGFRVNWARSAELCGEANTLQSELAREDLLPARTDQPRQLAVTPLLALPEVRRRNALRYFFSELAAADDMLPPGHIQLRRILQEVLPAADDAEPRVAWHTEGHQVEVRRFGGRLYVLSPLSPHDPSRRLIWERPAPLDLGPGLGTLSLDAAEEGELVLDPADRIEVAFRQGGERVRPAGGRERPLKKLLQQYQVPPWLRDRVPLLYRNGKLVAVGDLFTCQDARNGEGNRYRLIWRY